MSEGIRAGVIGWPVEHSRSPLIHRFWLARHAISGSYDKVPIKPDELVAFVGAMRTNGFRGVNVTVPHKEAVAALCDELSPAAARTGSVNTICLDGDTLCGDSTDGHGFLAALDQEAPGWNVRGRAIVLGAGGAGRAIVDALSRRGCEDIMVASRTFARAEALGRDLRCRAVEMAALPSLLRGAGLLVNTTPSGMAGRDPITLDLTPLPDHAVVDDIVYVPRETALMEAARARGLRTVGGLGMLLHQAVPGFARWFGVVPDVTRELRALLEADIERAS